MSRHHTISDLDAIETALFSKAALIERLEREVRPTHPGAAFALRAAHRELGVLRAARLLRLDLAELEDRIAAAG